MSHVRDLASERLNTLAEDSLAAVGETRVALTTLERAQQNIVRLQDARSIERERLVAHVAHCRADLREAEKDLERYDEIDRECEGIHVEIMDTLTHAAQRTEEDARRISIDAKNAGFAFAREELLAGGAKPLLERRRRVRDAGATKDEAEAI